MADHFSIVDVRIIQSLLEKKPVDYIAMIIDKPPDFVAKKIKELLCGSTRVAFADKAINDSIRKKTQKLNDSIFNDTIKKAKRVSRNGQAQKSQEVRFETRVIDYSKMVTVKIDAKTHIHVPAGGNIEKAKELFLKNQKSKQQITENSWKKVSKFK
jgi:hypothetical protein